MSHPEFTPKGYVHYGMTEQEARNKAGSNGSFEGPRPLCSNGSYHIGTTRHSKYVTCPVCLEKLATRPGYLGVIQ